ncbi:MAG: TonB-dependent receptor [Bacteroidetes bacterium]|nr:TonB-dependent receptor [Bacteroidota bacterium]
MKTFKCITTLALLMPAMLTVAQTAFQTVKGHVTDKVSKTELPGVTITIMNTSPLLGTSSDVDGKFKIAQVPVGRYDIKAAYMGYKEIVLPNVLVTVGKEVDLELEMEEAVSELQEVTVSATKKNETVNDMSTVSARSFNMEEVNRYSGGHGDPSRLVANFAGVSAPNDSRNDIVVRGNSPTGILWRIEGLNIPNPNHFSTMGTTGGPVSALNTNVLKNSDFMTSAFAPEYGNATAGVFDLGFRNGNSDKREYAIQMGMFTGLEAMAEGPINREKGSSYLFAYRYSFTGLAQDMGMKMGTNATPKYQDLSFKINGGASRFGKLSLFGLGGISNIDFLHNKIDSSDIYADPTRDMYFKSRIGLVGLSHFIKVNDKSYFKTVIGATISENSNKQDTINKYQGDVAGAAENLRTSQVNYSFNTSFNSKVNARFNYKAGVIGELMSLNLYDAEVQGNDGWRTLWDSHDNTMLLQAYAQGKYVFSEKLSLTGGLHTQYLTLNGKTAVEPRLAAKYQLTGRHALSFGYGWHEQTQPLSIYFNKQYNADGTYTETNKNLDFLRSQHFVVGYDFLPAADWRIKTEVYYQYLSQIPVTAYASSYASINEGASFAPTKKTDLSGSGSGHNYGVELTLEKFFSKGYYGLFTASLYDSKYKASDNLERNTAFNGKYTLNLLAGKEIKVGKAQRNVITIDTKLTSAGGKYYTPVDLAASQLAQKQVLMGDAYSYSQRYPNYYRWDVKVGYRLNNVKHHFSQSFFIDFQNITNYKNVYAMGYNKKTNQVNTAYQTGFLPNFIYRINF